MAERKKRFVSNKIAALLFSVLTLLLLLDFLSPYLLKNITNLHKIIIYVVIFLLPTDIYIRANRYKRAQMLKLKFVKIKYLPFILLFGLSTSVICALINTGIAAMADGLWDIRAAASTVGFVSENPFITALTMVFMPAICEELLIRGLALSEYEKYGVSVSVIMTSLIFSLFHGSLLTIPSLFIAGVFYAVLTHLFKSVYPAVICHCINNGLAIYISLNRDFVSYLLGDVIFVIILVIVLFAVLYLTLRLTENVIDDLGDKKRLKTNRRALVYGDPLKAVFIWLFFAVSIAAAVLKIISL